MIKITIKNLASKTIHCNSKTKSLLEILQDNYIDWMHACGGKGNCTTCKAIILEGSEQLAEHSASELRFMALKRLKPNERLACQCIVSNDICIKVPELYKLPHVTYSE